MTNDEIKEAIRSRRLFDCGNGQIRIMAFAENYFMVRRPTCAPSVLYVREFEDATGIKLAYR